MDMSRSRGGSSRGTTRAWRQRWRAAALVTALVGGTLAATATQAVASVAPDAPTNVVATAGDGQATVTWAPPASDGGAAIRQYKVAAQPGMASATVTGTETTATVLNLTNGVTYTFTVKATNADGYTSVASVKSAPVVVGGGTPATNPDPPTGVTATAGDSMATVGWTPPANDGGATVDSYIVASQPGSTTVTVDGTTTSADFTGLANGTAYTFTVRAVNSVGRSLPSAPSTAVTPGGPASPPDAPTNVVATAGDGRATITWTAPASNGAAILKYRVNVQPGSTAVETTSPSQTSADFAGLTNGTTYTFTVKAYNSAGVSPASLPSNPVSPVAAPKTAPGAPTGVSATATGNTATIRWSAPASGGSSPISSYRVTASPGGTSTVVSAPALTTRLNLFGGTYSFVVQAVNSVGTSAPSAASNTVHSVATVWGDFDGDGKADIIARKPDGELWLYSGSGTGHFGSPAARRIATGWQVYDRILSPSDFNGDGRGDIIARKPTGQLYLYLGNGKGGFLSTTPRQISTGWQGLDRLLSPGDFNGDGHTDIIARKPTGELYLFTGNGKGGFTSPAYHQISSGWQGLDRLVSPGDFNGDGHIDIIARKPTGELYLFTGNGKGGFTSPAYHQMTSGWQAFDRLLSPGDFNGDGHPDVITRKSTGALYLYTGNGKGGFTSPAYRQIGNGWGIYDILLGG